MRYYLGYFDNKHYIPIKDSNMDESIFDVVDFTTRFASISDLRNYLYERKLIPNRNVYLNYVIEKGQKNKKYYLPLKNTNRIYTSESRMFFSLQEISRLLLEEVNNPEFVVYLYAEYAKKFGITTKILDYLCELTERQDKLPAILAELKIIIKLDEAVVIIDRIINHYDLNDYTIDKYDVIDDLTSLMTSISKDSTSLSNMIICLRKYTYLNKIPAFAHLGAWLRNSISNGARTQVEIPDEYCSTEEECNAFFNEIAYEYDYKKHEYMKKNGERKIKERNVFDLGVLLEQYHRSLYEEYINAINDMNNSKNYEDDYDEYEKEEFLEEDDFERIGTTSEEAGIKLRINNY